MLTLELDQELEVSLLEIARKQHQTPAQIINQLLAEYLSIKSSSDLLVNAAQDLPAIEAFSEKDPLSLQQEMRDEWR